MTSTETDPAESMPPMERGWLEGTAGRTSARREALRAEAAEGVASLAAPAIDDQSDHGGEAKLTLRPGGILHIFMPGLDWVATLRAGDGWGNAVVSARILPAGAASGGAQPDGGREPYGVTTVTGMSAGMFAPLTGPVALPPAGFFRAVGEGLRDLHPQWEAGRVQAEAEALWKDMCERQ
jgi:hypothetical protein